MKRRIISIVLLFVITLLSVACKKEDKTDLLNRVIIAASSESGNIAAADDYSSAVGGDIIQYSSNADAVIAVINGKADCVVLDEYSGYLFEKENPELVFAEKCDYKIENCACFSMDDTELCEEFDRTIAAMKKDGTINEIKSAVYENKEYVGSEPTGEKGNLTMLCDPIFENRVWIDEEGTVGGVDVYIAREICSRLGYNLVIRKVKFEDMFTVLDNGEADFILSCMERTEQRAEHFLFSDVYVTYDYNTYKLK